MAIGILLHELPKRRFCRLSACSVDDAEWPLGDRPDVATLGDLSPDDQLVLTINSRTLTADRRGLRCRVSALIFEPPVIHGRFYRLIPWIGRAFHRVLTHNSRLLGRLPNARFLPHGGQYVVSPPDAITPKTGRVALIASKKRATTGQRLRHRIAAWSRGEAPELALLGSAYEPIAEKAEGHTPYYYSVVVENSREPGYFTEKLVDSLLCWSLPIYWGAPDIEHFFDPRGMIVCRNERDIHEAIRNCNEADYVARGPFLEDNRRRALEYADRRLNAARILQRDDDFTLAAA